jgi:hypothetical protein
MRSLRSRWKNFKIHTVFFSELLTEAEETVKYQALFVIGFKCTVSMFEKLIVNILPYSIRMIISCKSFTRIQRDLAACIKILHVFSERSYEFNIEGQQKNEQACHDLLIFLTC